MLLSKFDTLYKIKFILYALCIFSFYQTYIFYFFTILILKFIFIRNLITKKKEKEIFIKINMLINQLDNGFRI